MARPLIASLVDTKRGFLRVLWGIVGFIVSVIYRFEELASLDLLGGDVGGPGGGADAARRGGGVEMLEINVT